MLPKEKKITSSEMQVFFSSPKKKIYSPFFTLFYSSDQKRSNFAVVVSKSVTSKAVERNLIKRRFFNIIARIEKNIRPGIYVVVVNSKVIKTKKDVVLEEVEKFFYFNFPLN